MHSFNLTHHSKSHFPLHPTFSQFRNTDPVAVIRVKVQTRRCKRVQVENKSYEMIQIHHSRAVKRYTTHPGHQSLQKGKMRHNVQHERVQTALAAVAVKGYQVHSLVEPHVLLQDRSCISVSMRVNLVIVGSVPSISCRRRRLCRLEHAPG